jgi:hypothetical protein
MMKYTVLAVAFGTSAGTLIIRKGLLLKSINKLFYCSTTLLIVVFSRDALLDTHCSTR